MMTYLPGGGRAGGILLENNRQSLMKGLLAPGSRPAAVGILPCALGKT
jgi:hypothetical protein